MCCPTRSPRRELLLLLGSDLNARTSVKPASTRA
jgi:hypothetical protein